jgi:hypothetical protein
MTRDGYFPPARVQNPMLNSIFLNVYSLIPTHATDYFNATKDKKGPGKKKNQLLLLSRSRSQFYRVPPFLPYDASCVILAKRANGGWYTIETVVHGKNDSLRSAQLLRLGPGQLI